jgi:hypothetical protein
MARPITTPDEAFVAAVAASPGATAAEVAAALDIGQSTAQKRLAALDASGRVRRDPGGRVDGVRAPDRWHPTGTDAVASEPDTGSEAVGGPQPAEDAPASADGSERLGRGALAAMVRDYLAERPKESSAPPLSARPSAAPRGPSPMPWRRWPSAAKRSSSPTSLAATASPAESGRCSARTSYPKGARGTPRRVPATSRAPRAAGSAVRGVPRRAPPWGPVWDPPKIFFAAAARALPGYPAGPGLTTPRR